MAPTHAAGDEGRKLRREGVLLGEGRPVLPRTRDRRERLRETLVSWLAGRGTDWETFEGWARTDATKVNDMLLLYGRWLYAHGK